MLIRNPYERGILITYIHRQVADMIVHILKDFHGYTNIHCVSLSQEAKDFIRINGENTYVLMLHDYYAEEDGGEFLGGFANHVEHPLGIVFIGGYGFTNKNNYMKHQNDRLIFLDKILFPVPNLQTILRSTMEYAMLMVHERRLAFAKSRGGR